MHAFLISGNSKSKVDKIVDLLVKEHGKMKLEYNISKINDVRELNSFTKHKITKPISIIIYDFDKTTLEAQNAFLKNLEEPQENLTYILTCSTLLTLLPTIVSRCQIIIAQNKLGASKKQNDLTRSFINKSESQKLLYINSIRKKDQAMIFIEDLISGFHQIFIKEVNSSLANYLKTASLTLNNLKANGNVNLQLTNFVLTIQTRR